MGNGYASVDGDGSLGDAHAREALREHLDERGLAGTRRADDCKLRDAKGKKKKKKKKVFSSSFS